MRSENICMDMMDVVDLDMVAAVTAAVMAAAAADGEAAASH